MDNHLYMGRKEITWLDREIDDHNIANALIHALAIHGENASEIVSLWNYYRGDQKILRRVKETRPDINHKIVVNHAQELVRFKKGNLLAEPIQYVRASMTDEAPGETEDSDMLNLYSDEVTALNAKMKVIGKHKLDDELTEWLYVAGQGYRYLKRSRRGSRAEFQIATVDPSQCFVVYHSGVFCEPLMAVYISHTYEGLPIYTCYAPDRQWIIAADELTADKVIKGKMNPHGFIPIIEYKLNARRQSPLEVVLPLLNAINELASDRLNDVTQFVQAFMVFMNCEIDEENMRNFMELGAIMIKQTNATAPADIRTEDRKLDQTQTQIFADGLYEQYLLVSGMPNREGNTGGDTGEAVSRRNGWEEAEMIMRSEEQEFIYSEYELLERVLRILHDDSDFHLELSDLEVKFTRNPNANILTKAQGLLNLLTAGVHPRVALASSGLFADSEGTWRESYEYLKKWLPEHQEAEEPSVLNEWNMAKKDTTTEAVE